MKNGLIKKVLVILFLTLGISLVSFAHATVISLSLPSVNGVTNPCSNPTAAGCNPGNYVSSFYQFALMIGGLLAFGAVVFGGVKYITAAGNPSSQSEGKAWIESALLGLLLLAGAYLILNTVNPNLTHLSLPTLKLVQIQSTGPIQLPSGSNTDANQNPTLNTTPGGPCAGIQCAPGSTCVEIPDYSGVGVTTVECKPTTSH